jgi:tRNA A-37 threonylcarbamoyl transferase component Bud32
MQLVDRDWGRVAWFNQDDPTLSQITVAELDLILDQESTQIYKDDRTTTVCLAQFGTEQRPMVIKRFNARNRWHVIKRLFRKTRARRCWQMAQAFAEAGLKVAKPILMLEQRFGPLRFNAYYVTKHLNGVPLIDVIASLSENELVEVMAAVENLFSLFKDNRLTHGDMKASNLIWHENQLYLIDLDAAMQHQTDLTWRPANAKDKKRFLKNWKNNQDLYVRFKVLLDGI